MNCQDFEKLLLWYAYDELPAEERGDSDTHLAACAICRARLDETRRLQRLLSERSQPEPAPDLLARCRQGLDEALDREQLSWRALVRSWLGHWGAVPATRAAAVLTLLIFGFGLGWTVRPRLRVPQATPPAGLQSIFGSADLNHLRVRRISQVVPDPTSGGVRITLDAERRVTIEGSLDDPQIRELLVGAVKSYDNPGIRRDTLEVLRGRRQDPAVLQALLYSLRHDANAGVRLEALKAAGAVEVCIANTHAVLLDALQHDSNPGVRVAAIKALMEHVAEEGNDPEVTPVLRKLAESDRNPYVRSQCQVAIRQLEGNEGSGEER
jgi:hypothetical protein